MYRCRCVFASLSRIRVIDGIETFQVGTGKLFVLMFKQKRARRICVIPRDQVSSSFILKKVGHRISEKKLLSGI